MALEDADLPPKRWKLTPDENERGAITRSIEVPVEDIDGPEGLDIDPQDLEIVRATPLKWAEDQDSTEYAHLLALDGDPPLPELPREFNLTPDVLDLLIEANGFRPEAFAGKLVFALRGARLTGEPVQEGKTAIGLVDDRPDHKRFRCTIGFYDRIVGELSAYRASTVPNQNYMTQQMKGTGKSNMLPSGCYVYRKETHGYSHKVPIYPALRLTHPARLGSDGPATVLRSKNDLTYDFSDVWDDNNGKSPHDNIHCAYSTTKFSSAGCLTVSGSQRSGAWGRFQKTLDAVPRNGRMDLILLTSRDAAIARWLIDNDKAADTERVRRLLTRLRTGSFGREVEQLQSRLGIEPTGYFGYGTKKKLVETQAAQGLAPDGIYSERLDRQLGWNIMRLDTATPSTAPDPQTAVDGEPGPLDDMTKPLDTSEKTGV